MTTISKRLPLFPCLFLLACGTEPVPAGAVPLDATATELDLTSDEVSALLAFLNAPTTDFERLDQGARLNRLAAIALVEHRDGPDGWYPTDDDNPFDDLVEVDALDHLGPDAFARMLSYVAENPAAAGERVLGIPFTPREAIATVWGVNRATMEELTDAAGLTEARSIALTGAVPVESVGDLRSVEGIDGPTLAALRERARVWMRLMEAEDDGRTLAGAFDGVYFDEVTARTALEVANVATPEQLTNEAGLWTPGANRVVAGRPFANLEEVAELYGVGQSTLESLEAYAGSGRWRLER